MSKTFFKHNQGGIIAGVIIVVLGVVFFWPHSKLNDSDQDSQLIKQQKNNTSPAPGDTPKNDENLATGTGQLKYQTRLLRSDKKDKGNLMVKLDGRNIYIRTSRDYSQLLDKEVVLTGSGSLENFVLKSIVAAQ